MKLRIHTAALALGLMLAAFAGTASATQTAPKPGFVPGTWSGSGTISGASVDGPMSTVHTGQIRFRLVVAGDRSVSGSATWKRTMKGSGADTKSVIIGNASLKFSGPSSEARFTGKEYILGRISASGVTVPMGMPPKALTGTLVVIRAGDCTANGVAEIPSRPGLKLKWTAKRAIDGTCNA